MHGYWIYTYVLLQEAQRAKLNNSSFVLAECRKGNTTGITFSAENWFLLSRLQAKPERKQTSKSTIHQSGINNVTEHISNQVKTNLAGQRHVLHRAQDLRRICIDNKTLHCIEYLFSYELRRCPIWKAPEWGQWVNVASDSVSPTPHNFLKRKLRVEVLARRFNLPEPIPTHKSPCLPRAKNYGSLLETVNNNQIRVQHTLLLGLSVYTP